MSRASLGFSAASAICIAVALIALHPPGEPGVFMRDFEAYYSAGVTWIAHHDPYSRDIWRAQSSIPGVVRARHEVLPFVGLPATLPFWGSFARLPYLTAAQAWAGILVGAVIAIVLATWRLARAPGGSIFAIMLAALSFVPITSDFGLGQAAMPAYAAALLAMTSPFAAAVFACVVACLQPNVALGLAVMFFERSKAAALAIAAAAVVMLGGLAQGLGWIAHYVEILREHAAAERFAVIQYTPASVLFGFGMSADRALNVSYAVAAIVLAVALRGMFGNRSMPQRFLVACCAVPFVAGFFHEHDFVVLFAPAIAALLYAKRAWIATIATLLAGVNWLDFAQQPQGRTQDLVLALGLLCAAVALRPQRSQLWAACASIVTLAIGAVLGAQHPLPIWPNDMHGVPAGATIAAVWKNEQLQTGLLRPDAAAAVLRCFALLGAALLLWMNLNIDVHHVVERGDSIGMEVL